jgi:hypothetical protein
MEDLLIKAATVIAVALATFSSFPGTAQQDPAAQQQGSPAQAGSTTTTPQNPTQPNAGSGTANPAAAELKPVSGELVNKLDSKSAKQGDSVVVKTDESLTISPGTEIPKGSKLLGRVTNVQARGDGKENSQIAIQFDRAELKGGQTLPIESVIQSVAPSSDDTMTNNVSGGIGANAALPNGGTAGTPAAPGASPAAGTMNQGTMSANRPGLASNTTVQPGMTDQNTNGSARSQGTPAPGSIVAQNGNVAIRATAIPGVLLANDIHGLPFTNASGMLLGARRDVHLDGGTRFVLAVAMAPQGAGSGMNR